MCTGRYDRLSTRTLLCRISLTSLRDCYTLAPGKSIFLSGTGGLRGWPPAQDRAAGSARLVEAGHARRVRRPAYELGLRARLLRDGAHRVHELVERLARLRLRGLDHEGAADDQRKVDGRSVEAVIEEALGDVHRLHPAPLLDAVGEHAFMQRRAVVRQVVGIAEPRAKVVCVQHGVSCDVLQARAAEPQH